MASLLLNSPADILDMVLELLAQEDLLALCLTCKELRVFAEPLVYSHVQLIWANNKKTPLIVPLLRIIIRKPTLADLIQSVHLSGSDFELSPTYHNHPNPLLQVTDMDVNSLVQCVQGMNVPYSQLWIEGLTSGNMAAFVALLLSQLSNLRSLHIEPNFTRKSHLVGMVFQSALCEEVSPLKTRFEHLRNVYTVYPRLGIDIREASDARNTPNVLPFFYLPSIEHLTTSIDNPVTTFTWPAPHPPTPLRLQSLELSMIREGHLGELLSVTSRLQRLRWFWYYRPDLEDQWVTDIIDLEKITAGLFIASSLTAVAIDASADKSRADPDFPPLTVKGIGSFRRLHNLKQLQVPLPFLLGFQPDVANMKLAEILPRGIEILTITDDLYFQTDWEWSDIQLYEVLALWLQDWKSFTPHLKKAHLLLELADSMEWGPEMREKLKDLGAEAGIEIEITKVAGD
jgi:hypothetical protein